MFHQRLFNLNEIVIGNVLITEENRSVPALYIYIQIFSSSFMQNIAFIPEQCTERNETKFLDLWDS